MDRQAPHLVLQARMPAGQDGAQNVTKRFYGGGQCEGLGRRRMGLWFHPRTGRGTRVDPPDPRPAPNMFADRVRPPRRAPLIAEPAR